MPKLPMIVDGGFNIGAMRGEITSKFNIRLEHADWKLITANVN
jgi:hypothetical protein